MPMQESCFDLCGSQQCCEVLNNSLTEGDRYQGPWITGTCIKLPRLNVACRPDHEERTKKGQVVWFVLKNFPLIHAETRRLATDVSS